jgi:hypothetical protein
VHLAVSFQQCKKNKPDRSQACRFLPCRRFLKGSDYGPANRWVCDDRPVRCAQIFCHECYILCTRHRFSVQDLDDRGDQSSQTRTDFPLIRLHEEAPSFRILFVPLRSFCIQGFAASSRFPVCILYLVSFILCAQHGAQEVTPLAFDCSATGGRRCPGACHQNRRR